MSETNTTIDKRRKTDATTSHDVLVEIQSIAVEIRDRVANIEARQASVDTAFVNNDIGRPDYDGHRREHSVIKKQSNTIENYKVDITKKILEWLAIGAIVLVGSGLINKVAALVKTLPG